MYISLLTAAIPVNYTSELNSGNFLKLLQSFVSIRNYAKVQEDADCYTHLRIVHGSQQCTEGSIQGHHLSGDDSLLYRQHQQVVLVGEKKEL